MENQDKAFEFVRQFLKERKVRIPAKLPEKMECGTRVRVRKAGISLYVTFAKVEAFSWIQIEIVLGDGEYGETDGFPIIAITVEEGDSGLSWCVAVDTGAPMPFGHFRAHFLPHKADTNFGLSLPHEEGVRWLDRLVQDFLSYKAA